MRSEESLPSTDDWAGDGPNLIGQCDSDDCVIARDLQASKCCPSEELRGTSLAEFPVIPPEVTMASAVIGDKPSITFFISQSCCLDR